VSQLILTAADFVENNVGRGLPDESFKGVSFQVASHEYMEPGTAGEREVEMETSSSLWFEPVLYGGAFVGAVVVAFPIQS
jgi:hypothetical protein